MWLATQVSYGMTERLVSALVGERIPKQSVWKLVQDRGRRLEEEARQEREAVFEHGKLPAPPARTAPALFGEADGCMIALQRAKAKQAEVKVGVWYDGWEKKAVGREEYGLVNKAYVATLGRAEAFWEEMSLVAESRYGRSEVPTVFVGGDGAPWIQEGAQVLGADRVKLDAFHLHRLLGRAFGFAEPVGGVVADLLRGEWEGPLEVLARLAWDEPDQKKRVKMAKAIGFVDQHRESLAKLPVKQLGRGLVSRQLGTMERHVDLVVADRFKKRGMSWSVPGAERLVRLRVQVCCGQWRCPLPESVAVSLGPTSSKRGRHTELPVHEATMPVFIGPHQGRPWVKRLKARVQLVNIGAA